jgi:hypothetical protein
VFYGSNLSRKDNPRWGISNATETPKVPEATFRGACGICFSWLIGLPRRAGARLHATDDAEARWWRWEVTERYGGLVRWYRDTRFAALPHNAELRRDELRDHASPDSILPDCPCAGDH